MKKKCFLYVSAYMAIIQFSKQTAVQGQWPITKGYVHKQIIQNINTHFRDTNCWKIDTCYRYTSTHTWDHTMSMAVSS
jgi:hypothetical protein